MEHQIEQQFESSPPDAQILVAEFIMFLQQRYQYLFPTQQTQRLERSFY